MATNNKDSKKQINKTETPSKRKGPTEKQKQGAQVEMQKVSSLTLTTGILMMVAIPVIYLFSLGSGLNIHQTLETIYHLYIFIVMPAGVIVSIVANTRVKKLRNAIGEIPHDRLWKKYTIGKILCLLPAIFMIGALVSSVGMFVMLFMMI